MREEHFSWVNQKVTALHQTHFDVDVVRYPRIPLLQTLGAGDGLPAPNNLRGERRVAKTGI